MFLIGLIMFGIATMRAAMFPRRASLLLIVGGLVWYMVYGARDDRDVL